MTIMRSDSPVETDIVRRDSQFAGNVVAVDSVPFHRAPVERCMAIDRYSYVFESNCVMVFR
ncbi:hypothetical protein [Rhodococcus koreensis]|uniref:Uncharacterized protein n=1 Tax=Rhodococcus koreensis TaxID=99653 RepID=A0A1H4RA77_9NOCA|nr:hypothetical protein [Rhodococcus koreensis]SEC28799.1 hypothetical protein SAMN04490239_3547 [Rhodococcus koreensis]